MILVAALLALAPVPKVYYTLRSRSGSFWFQTKAPIDKTTTVKPVKGSKINGRAVESVTFEFRDFQPMKIVAKVAPVGGFTWTFEDPAILGQPGDYKTVVGVPGTLSVTIKP